MNASALPGGLGYGIDALIRATRASLA